jgi:hypothetical protein
MPPLLEVPGQADAPLPHFAAEDCGRVAVADGVGELWLEAAAVIWGFEIGTGALKLALRGTNRERGEVAGGLDVVVKELDEAARGRGEGLSGLLDSGCEHVLDSTSLDKWALAAIVAVSGEHRTLVSDQKGRKEKRKERQ